MSKSKIVIGDVHGCFDTLQALIAQLPHDDICFVGDLIDRGPKSKDVVQLVIDKGYDCVLGNHEQMMLDDNRNMRQMGVWFGNGGKECMESYGYKDGKFESDEAAALYDKHLDFMSNLPLFNHYTDIKNDEGRELVTSHSHVCNVWRYKDHPEHDTKYRFRQEILWGRPRILNQRHNDGIYNIIGHSPVEKARIRTFYANADSGCFYIWDKEGYGHMTAIEYPSMKVWTQKCIDDIKWKPFGV